MKDLVVLHSDRADEEKKCACGKEKCTYPNDCEAIATPQEPYPRLDHWCSVCNNYLVDNNCSLAHCPYKK